jgi:hypothetical protein
MKQDEQNFQNIDIRPTQAVISCNASTSVPAAVRQSRNTATLGIAERL